MSGVAKMDILIHRNKKYFKRILRRNFPESYNSILFETEKSFRMISRDTKFSMRSKNPLDRRLNLIAYFLALILSLNENQLEFDEIKSICISIAKEIVRPKNRFQSFLKKLPVLALKTGLASPLLSLIDIRINKKWHDDGFRAALITGKEETFGFGYGVDILECGVCKLFDKHNAAKYTPILCQVDMITSEFAGLELIRQSTIAGGAEKCEFRFRKMKRSEM